MEERSSRGIGSDPSIVIRGDDGRLLASPPRSMPLQSNAASVSSLDPGSASAPNPTVIPSDKRSQAEDAATLHGQSQEMLECKLESQDQSVHDGSGMVATPKQEGLKEYRILSYNLNVLAAGVTLFVSGHG